MEIWDIYDAYREKTGRTHIRGEDMQAGDFHQVVHVWIVNDKGEYLIQKRQPWKKGWPNMWDCSAAGSAIAGDTSEMAAIREVKEELGIDLNMEQAEFLFTIKFARGFDDIWLVRQNVSIDDVILQDEEVAEAKWVTAEELRNMVRNGEFIRFSYIDSLFEMMDSAISMKKATVGDLEELFNMQKEVFIPLYEKYEDHQTSPVVQSFERFKGRFETGNYYKINYDGKLAGGVNVFQKSPGVMRFHIINILEQFQNKGITQKVMSRLESMYPQATSWELDTIMEEERNCYLYEKMGYVKTGDMMKINDRMTIGKYVKQENLNHYSAL